MEIQDNRERNKHMLFSELAVGDIFQCDDYLFMKIPDIYDEKYGDNNCFDLFNNCLCYCRNDDTVEILKCKLIINK